jgi:hypothetical protein
MNLRSIPILIFLFLVQITDAQIVPFGFLNKPTIKDPYWANVVLLMPMEINFNDAKGHTPSLIGPPSISSVNNPATYGTNCGQFAVNKRVEFADSDDWFLGQTYTVEFWMKPTSADLDAGIHAIFNQRDGPLSGHQWGLNGGKIFHWTNGSNTFTSATSGSPVLTAGTSYHIACVYEAAGSPYKIRVYINGILQAALTSATQPTETNYVAVLAIGGEGSYGQNFSGTLKDMRVTKGVARYNSNFTPPTTFYPTQ